MTYSELLQQREWIDKSASIIQRDAFRCQNCGSIGYHSMSFCICKDSRDLDHMFEGWKFNNHSFSTFIEKEIESSSKYEKCIKSSVSPICMHNNERFQLNGYFFFRISSNCTECVHNDVDRTAYCICQKELEMFQVYSRRFRDESADCYGKGLKIQNSNDEAIYLDWGNTYVFSHNLTNTYVVSVEYVYPTGVAWNGYEYSAKEALYGSVIISITYKNFVGSFYFNQSRLKGLNVHHKYYIKGKAPWEYEDDALITLCEDCHKKAHLTHIPVYREIDRKRLLYCNAIKCSRCNGSGYLPQYEHVENGICFKCWGEGVMLESLE